MLGIHMLVSSKYIPSSGSTANEDTHTYTHHSDLIHDAITHVHPQVKVVLCLPVRLPACLSLERDSLMREWCRRS